MSQRDDVADHLADGAIISPSFAYGITVNCTNNLHYLEGQRLLYPAGKYIVNYSADEGKSTFISAAATAQAVHVLQLSANKRHLAAAEWSHNTQQQVSVYNVPAQKREQTLLLAPHTRSTTVTALSFSADTKFLLTLTGEPDWTVLLWRWQQAKVVLVVNPDCAALGACLSPWDDNLMAVAGPHIVKAYRFDNRTGTSKASNVLMLDSHKSTMVTCTIHLVGGLLAVGTNAGKVMICSATGLQSVHDITPAGARQATSAGAAAPAAGGAEPSATSCSGSRSRSGSGAVTTPRPSSAAGTPRRGRSSAAPPRQEVLKNDGKGGHQAAGMYAVQALVLRGRGFIAVGSMGDVYLFDPAGSAGGRGSGSADAFCMSQRFVFAETGSSAGNSLTAGSSSLLAPIASGSVAGSSVTAQGDAGPFSHLPPALRVSGLAVSTTDEHLAIATAAGKIMWLNIAAALEAQEEADSTNNTVQDAEAAAKQVGSGDSSPAVVANPEVLDSASAMNSAAAVQSETPGWQVVSSGFPTCRVIGLDAVQHLPLLLVVSEDGWVRVWDWMRRTRLATHHLGSRQPLCCSLHTSGLMAAVGTTDGLLVFWVLKGALSTTTELPVAKCNIARYSHAGGLLAAAGGSNTIFVYPAYYGHEGAAGRASSSRAPARSHSAAAAAGSGEGGAVLEAVVVLKGHVSSVTDLVFTGDDMRLISTGAGGAVYFWDLSTGSRLIELEYVDKKCVYCSASYSDHHAAAIVRTMDGRIQHIKGGQLAYEASGLAQDCCPMALTGDGRVVLAATSSGSVISIGCPKHPEEDSQHHQGDVTDLGFGSISGAAGAAQPASVPPINKLGLHAAGAYRHLSVQVDAAGGGASPRDTNSKSGSSTPRGPAAGVAGVSVPGPAGSKGGVAGGNKGSVLQQPQARPGTSSSSDQEQGPADGGSHALSPGRHEYRLHTARVTAMKVLHHAGIMFTASADGVVFMSSISLVLDGVLIEPPPPALPLSATVQGSSWTIGAFTGATGTATGLGALGLPPPVVLVDDGVILGLHERIKALQHNLSVMQREAQYQVLRETQALKELLAASDSQVAALRTEAGELTAQLEHCKHKAVADQEQILKELEGLHSSAAEQLEGLYEARLALEKEKLRQMAAAKDDLELSLKEEMIRRASAAAQELAEVDSMYKQQLSTESARAEAAAVAAAEADAVYQEVLLQTEEELEKRAVTDSERLATLQRTAEETQVKLRAEANILSRANERLKAEKATDAARVAALQQELKALQQQLVDAGTAAGKLRSELGERDGVIGDNYVTMQGLRRRVQELETHKFVLTYKNEAAASELQPKEEQLELMQVTVQAQDKELLAARSALLAAQRAVGERSAAIAAAKQELWEAKRKMAHQAALLDAVAHDIAHVLQQPDERLPGGKTASQQAMERLAIKYCTKRGGGPRTSVQVESEMVAHIAAAEKKSNIMERQLNQALADKQQNKRRLMFHNTALLADVAELQRSNKDLVQKLAAATHQLVLLQQAQVADGSVAGPASGEQTNRCAAGVQSAENALPHRTGRSQGVRAGGQLVPANEGRFVEAALRQQWHQLAELQAALDAATGVVVLQAAQIAHLQEHAAGDEQQQQLEAKSAEAARGSSSSSQSPGPAAVSPGRQRKTAEGSRWSPVEPGKLMGGPSPRSATATRAASPAGSMLAKRPPTSGHQGMMASLKSDLEAWRAK